MTEIDARLAPVLEALDGEGPRYTPGEVAERAGLEREFLDRLWRALGMALSEPGDAVYTDRDVHAAKQVADLRDAGLPDAGILEISRLLGMTMSQLAAANRAVIGDAIGAEDMSEGERAARLAAAVDTFGPALGESLGYVLTLHLREQLRQSVIAGTEADATQRVTVCFADMVGFTQLGEKLAPDELGLVTGTFAELATEAVEPPVRLVKLIGDAAMLVGPEPGDVLDAALELVERSGGEGGDFPILRAGLATGKAIGRGGDWYGAPVNLASRITDRARPGSVLAAEQVHDGLEDSYRWSFAGARRLKGIDGDVKLFRARRLDDSDASPA